MALHLEVLSFITMLVLFQYEVFEQKGIINKNVGEHYITIEKVKERHFKIMMEDIIPGLL